jgi:hypothetical protein
VTRTSDRDPVGSRRLAGVEGMMHWGVRVPTHGEIHIGAWSRTPRASAY